VRNNTRRLIVNKKAREKQLLTNKGVLFKNLDTSKNLGTALNDGRRVKVDLVVCGEPFYT